MVLQVDIKAQGDGAYVISLIGRLDGETYRFFDEEIKPLFMETTKLLVFDMDKLDYVSSIGMGVIFHARKVMEDNQGKIVMVNLQPQIKKVFDMVKLLPAKGLFESMEELDKYLDGVQSREKEEK